jgi:thiosulfate dehydrogenase
MGKKLSLIVAVLIVLCYVGAIAAGLRIKNFSLLDWEGPKPRTAWQPPHSLPTGSLGDSVRHGELIFNETPVYASQYTPSKVSCASCHAEGGIQPYASPMVGLPAKFPMFNARAGHMISLKDRVQECFVRSENGRPLAYDGEEMSSIVNYIEWLSQKPKTMKAFVGRGLIELPNLTPDADHGANIYAQQCSGCHGANGEGNAPKFPPLWGLNSFNDGAGMHGIPKMAAFVQHNMPQNRMGILTPQEAYDVSAFIHAQQRPAFNPAYKHF